MTDLSIEDRREIEWNCSRLVALYANLNDEKRWHELAALYAQNAAMSRPTTPDVFIEGRDAIEAAFTGRPPRATRHICSNVVIDVESNTTARGTSAMVLYTANDTAIVGSFHDRFVLTGEGWRFAVRRGSLAFS